MRVRTKLAMAVALALPAFALSSQQASAHGWSVQPADRQSTCADQGSYAECGDIMYEPQSVEAPKGFPESGPADGSICSGGIERFAQLDDPRDGNWPTTKLTAGQGYTFEWTFTAEHSTDKFEYFITKDGWDPTKPLTRDDLEPEPFLTVPMNGDKPTSGLSQAGTIPTGKSGHHLILSVWTVADTANAFYSCSDVDITAA
ncbi:lytic polysaccharide monooxygenase auxiliary activity family 9 protein [Microlunatus soli]|uniref:Chitin-binding protein n=1 Tax=Microlunatus soli TaxID=630515 RepID=A0A1H1ZH97_9ACTN|nr:lytic polysaccharide monooxygenase [Microlunatus soli]SDT33013.1 chitin-binding protein [Microlunatus soli]